MFQTTNHQSFERERTKKPKKSLLKTLRRGSTLTVFCLINIVGIEVFYLFEICYIFLVISHFQTLRPDLWPKHIFCEDFWKWEHDYCLTGGWGFPFNMLAVFRANSHVEKNKSCYDFQSFSQKIFFGHKFGFLVWKCEKNMKKQRSKQAKRLNPR